VLPLDDGLRLCGDELALLRVVDERACLVECGFQPLAIQLDVGNRSAPRPASAWSSASSWESIASRMSAATRSLVIPRSASERLELETYRTDAAISATAHASSTPSFILRASADPREASTRASGE